MISPEAFQHLGKLFLCHADLPAGKHRAGGILGIGGDAQKQLRFVGLFGVFKNSTPRVARPTNTGSTPVAMGSSVPPWPMRRVPNTRRSRAVTS